VYKVSCDHRHHVNFNIAHNAILFLQIAFIGMFTIRFGNILYVNEFDRYPETIRLRTLNKCTAYLE